MSALDFVRYEDPLDILLRFTPTPLRARFRIPAATLFVETNDFSLLPALPLETSSAVSLRPASIGSWFATPMRAAFCRIL